MLVSLHHGSVLFLSDSRLLQSHDACASCHRATAPQGKASSAKTFWLQFTPAFTLRRFLQVVAADNKALETGLHV